MRVKEKWREVELEQNSSVGLSRDFRASEFRSSSDVSETW